MLHRRRFLTTASRAITLGGGALLLLPGRGAWAQPNYTVPLAQLQEMVATKFPRSVSVQGLFDLTLQSPRLRLLPEVNRLGAVMAVDAAGAALRRWKAAVPSGRHGGLPTNATVSPLAVTVMGPGCSPRPSNMAVSCGRSWCKVTSRRDCSASTGA